MGKLQRYGAQKWSKTKRTAALPGWAPAVGLAMLVIIGAVLLWTLFVGGSSGTLGVNNPQGSGGTIPSSGGGGAIIVSTTIPGPGINTGGPSTNVATTSGGSCSVATAAYDLAQRAVVADYSGSFAGISFAGPAPTPAGRYTNVTASNATMSGCNGSGAIYISFEVSGDAVATTSVTVAVTNGNGPWQVQGFN